MFSLGTKIAELNAIDRSRFNAYMRATTSTAWIMGPALTFAIADQVGVFFVFKSTLALSVLWLCVWWHLLPRDINIAPSTRSTNPIETVTLSTSVWRASVFIFLLSLAHSIAFATLPLFYVQELRLPGYVPGLAVSIKTAVEVLVIFSTPVLVRYIGIYRVLIIASVLAVFTLFWLMQVQTIQGMVAGAISEGIYYGIYASLGISYLQSFAKTQIAKVTALYWNILMVSGLFAGPIVGGVAHFYSFKYVLAVAAVCAGMAAIVLIYGHRQTHSLP
jgi:SET family sugar efflux transporter-like MFS transporter